MERTDRYNIDRFIEAQANETRGYLVALNEVKSGRKNEHWIWSVSYTHLTLPTSP
jgi:uncharacterized protein (DUF1810 family)